MYTQYKKMTSRQFVFSGLWWGCGQDCGNPWNGSGVSLQDIRAAHLNPAVPGQHAEGDERTGNPGVRRSVPSRRSHRCQLQWKSLWTGCAISAEEGEDAGTKTGVCITLRGCYAKQCAYLMYSVGGSSVDRAFDQKARRNTDMGSGPQCSKGFFSQSQLPVQTLLWCPYSPCVQSHSSTSVHVKNPKHWQP